MSSALKDARWQLAIDMANEKGLDFFALKHGVKDVYLHSAHLQLTEYGSQDLVDRLAAKFRSHD